MSNNSPTTSGFVSNNSTNNSPTEGLKSTSTSFSSVFFKHESEQHLNSGIVFSPLPLFITHPLQIDPPPADPDIDFEDLILHLAYGSSSSSSFSSFPSNNIIEDSNSQQEFLEFHKLPVHVFFSSSSFYYSLQQPYNSKSH
jgi:hypothetical protein